MQMDALQHPVEFYKPLEILLYTSTKSIISFYIHHDEFTFGISIHLTHSHKQEDTRKFRCTNRLEMKAC